MVISVKTLEKYEKSAKNRWLVRRSTRRNWLCSSFLSLITAAKNLKKTREKSSEIPDWLPSHRKPEHIRRRQDPPGTCEQRWQTSLSIFLKRMSIFETLRTKLMSHRMWPGQNRSSPNMSPVRSRDCFHRNYFSGVRSNIADYSNLKFLRTKVWTHDVTWNSISLRKCDFWAAVPSNVSIGGRISFSLMKPAKLRIRIFKGVWRKPSFGERTIQWSYSAPR